MILYKKKKGKHWKEEIVNKIDDDEDQVGDEEHTNEREWERMRERERERWGYVGLLREVGW